MGNFHRALRCKFYCGAIYWVSGLRKRAAGAFCDRDDALSRSHLSLCGACQMRLRVELVVHGLAANDGVSGAESSFVHILVAKSFDELNRWALTHPDFDQKAEMQEPMTSPNFLDMVPWYSG